MAKRVPGICVVALALTTLVGCAREGAGSKNGYKEVAAVRLTCIQTCLEREDRPFAEKTFEDREEVKAFVQAADGSSPMLEAIDYGAMFLMTWTMQDGSNQAYHLNVSNTKNRQNGLLVKLPDTERGYTLSEAATEQLRAIIYEDAAK